MGPAVQFQQRPPGVGVEGRQSQCVRVSAAQVRQEIKFTVISCFIKSLDAE